MKRKKMKRVPIFILSLVLILIISTSLMAGEKTALVIIAHGSPSKTWNKNVLDLYDQINATIQKKGKNPFEEIRIAFMEMNEPSIATVIQELEKSGVNKIYVQPLFIAPSGHSRFDIPAILGVYYEKDKVNELKEEGISIVKSTLQVTIGPELSYGDVLPQIILDRVKELSINPKEEGVILLAHGAEGFEPIWEKLSRETGSVISAGTSINKFDYTFVEVGQSFMTKGIPTILKMAGKTKRTIVVGLYLAMDVERMSQNCSISTGMMKLESQKMLGISNISFSKKGLLPDSRIAEWIVDRALEWIEHNR